MHIYISQIKGERCFSQAEAGSQTAPPASQPLYPTHLRQFYHGLPV